ncbi:unnamed protein product [Diplocarpon coronariae]
MPAAASTSHFHLDEPVKEARPPLLTIPCRPNRKALARAPLATKHSHGTGKQDGFPGHAKQRHATSSRPNIQTEKQQQQV